MEGGTRAVVPEFTRLGGREAAGLERVRWRRETSGCVQMDTVGSETSDRARDDMVEVGQTVALELTQ